MKKLKSVFLVLMILVSICLSGCTANTPKGDIPVGAVQSAADNGNEKGDGSEGQTTEQKEDQAHNNSQADQPEKNSGNSPGTGSPSQSTAVQPDSVSSANKPADGSGQGASGSSSTEKKEAPSVPAVAADSTPEANSKSSPDPNPNVANTVRISINCQTAVDKGLHLDEQFKEVVPADGIILAPLTVEFEAGETVFDVFKRVVREHKIHMEYEGSKGTPYIQGINNLYEFDGGPLSGWMYCVNKVYPNYGCGEYKVKAGDIIEWNYTCDLGKDLGQTWLGE